MASFKARLLGGWVGDQFLRDATVADVADLAPLFRRVTLSGASLRGVAFTPGDKVQIFLPDVGSRTYTPFGFDAGAGRFELLAYLHGDGPGATWARKLTRGDRVRIFGPRSSLPLPALTGPVALFGDETSIAVARALQDLRPGDGSLARLEVTSLDQASAAAIALGLPAGCCVARQAGGAHRGEMARALVEGARGGTLVLTGDAHAIQDVRAKLRGASSRATQKVRAYWAEGKRGLD